MHPCPQCNGKPCILVLPVYVDNLLPMGNKELTDNFETYIGKYFKVTILGNASHFLGIRIIRDRSTNSLSLDQIAFADQILDKFNVKNVQKPASTPLSTGEKLVPSEETVKQDDCLTYQQIVGSVMYLMLGTCPDLAFAIGLLARFSSNPSQHHIKCLKHLLGFILHTRKRYLFFDNADLTGPELEAYTDSDYAGDHSGRKSTSGYVFLYSNTAFSWRSRLQDTTAVSTMEAEYIALYHASLNAIWVRNFFEQIGMALPTPLTIHCDNQPAIAVAQGEAPHKKSKHFKVKLHVVREHLQRRMTNIEYVFSAENTADIFTKALPHGQFVLASTYLGLHDFPASPDPDQSSDSLFVDAQDT